MLWLYIFWDAWLIFMISASNEPQQQQVEYTLLKPDCHSWWISKMQSRREEERYTIKFCFKFGTKCNRNVWNASDCFWSVCMNQASVFVLHKKFKKGRESVSVDERCGRSKEVKRPELIGQRVRVRVRVTMLRFQGRSGRDSVGRGQHSSNRVSGISTRTMHKSTTPSLSQTIWPKWASRQLLILLIVQTLLPVSLGYFLSSETVVMRQLRRWKSLWWRSLKRSYKRTSIGPSRICCNCTTSALQSGEIASKGTEFHVRTINKSDHTKKVEKLI